MRNKIAAIFLIGVIAGIILVVFKVDVLNTKELLIYVVGYMAGAIVTAIQIKTD